MDSPFDHCDDLILRAIAQTLIDARQWHSLAELAQTCRRWQQIAQPLIAQYDAECEARTVVVHDELFGERVEWYDEDGLSHRYHDLPAIIDAGGRGWFRHGKYQRANFSGETNGPTVIYSDKTQVWMRNDIRSPSSDPVLDGEEIQEGFMHGVFHRDGENAGPAIIDADGKQEWYQYGLRHRAGPNGEDIGPAFIGADGTQIWFQRGKRHRAGGRNTSGVGSLGQTATYGEDIGPAIIRADGSRGWYQHGVRHRAGLKGEDIGPAIIHVDGRREWWQHGKMMREERIAPP
jgi:hypothetical protein